MSKSLGRINTDQGAKRIKIDQKDKRILTSITNDSRIPLTKIAKSVALSRDAVNYRIERLKKNEVILRFFPRISYELLGFFIFHVFFRVSEKNKEKQKDLLDFLTKHKNVFSVIGYNDKWDLEVSLIARDLLEYDQIFYEILSFNDVIVERDKVEVIKRYTVKYLPKLIAHKEEKIEKLISQTNSVKLDGMDFKILRCLSENSRESSYYIGERVNLSSDAVINRIKNLVSIGVIKGFTSLINLSKLGFYWYTFALRMGIYDHSLESKVEEFVRQNDNIIRAVKTLGEWDFLFYMCVENPNKFHELIKKVKEVFAKEIKNYDVWLAYKEHYFNPFPEVLADATNL